MMVFLPFYLCSQNEVDKDEGTHSHVHGQNRDRDHNHEHITMDGRLDIGTDFYFTNADSSSIIQPKRSKGVYRFNFNPVLKKGNWSLTSKVSMLSNQANFSDINKDFLSDYRNNVGLYLKYKKQFEFQVGRIYPATTKMVSQNIPMTGTGMIYQKDKIAMSFYYGHTGRAKEENTLLNTSSIFRRDHYIGNIRIGDEYRTSLGLNFLLAKDSEASLLPSQSIQPKQNLVGSIYSNIKLGKSSYLKFELASSLLTNNTYLSRDSVGGSGMLKAIVGLNESTRSGYATSGIIGTKRKNISLNLSIKYCSPEYNTLGVFYQQKDFLDILTAFKFRAFKNKLIVHSSSGIRWRQIEQNKLTGGKNIQFIGNYNLFANPTEAFSLSAYYTNFNLSITDGTERFIYNEDEFMVDTIPEYKIRMTSNNWGITPSYVLGKDKQHRIHASYNLNTFRNADVFSNTFSSENTTSNIVLGYLYKREKYSLGINTGYFTGKGIRDVDYIHLKTYARIQLLKNKMRLDSSIKYAKNEESNSSDHRINARLGLAYRVKHNISAKVEIIENIHRYGVIQNNFKLNETRLRTSLNIKF